MPLEANMAVELGPDGTGSLMPGNTRNLKVYPVEVEVEPGKEYIAIIQYLIAQAQQEILVEILQASLQKKLIH